MGLYALSCVDLQLWIALVKYFNGGCFLTLNMPCTQSSHAISLVSGLFGPQTVLLNHHYRYLYDVGFNEEAVVVIKF